MSETHYPLSGHSSCGEVKYELLDRPLVVHCGHCTRCQRETGASFAFNAFIETSKVKQLEGNVEKVNVPTRSGEGQDIFRCKTCPIALWSHYSGASDKICLVRFGTLDDHNALGADIDIYTSTRQTWLNLADDIPSRYT